MGAVWVRGLGGEGAELLCTTLIDRVRGRRDTKNSIRSPDAHLPFLHIDSKRTLGRTKEERAAGERGKPRAGRGQMLSGRVSQGLPVLPASASPVRLLFHWVLNPIW